MKHLIFVILLFSATAAHSFKLGVPVDCAVGKDCFVQNYVDVDHSEEWRDFTCGKLSYDGHKGTDFRVKDFVAMERGVAVIAAADGTVKGTRNNMEDTGNKDLAAIKNKECGNGLLLQHPDGWQTQYCHMKKGSVTVREGQVVKKGDVLGQIGYSGNTAFPHLHLSVRHKGKSIDPFTATAQADSACGSQSGDNLWAKEMPYISTALLGSGFTAQKPDYEGIKRGAFREKELQPTADYLIAWVHMMGVRPGDILSTTIMSPGGAKLLDKQTAYDRARATQFNYFGIKRKGSRWLEGDYAVSFRLIRDGRDLFIKHMTVPVGK